LEVHALRQLARDLLRLQEEQRHALSRELHDNIAQVLSATCARLAMVRKRAGSKALQRELAEVRHALEQIAQTVGDLSRSLRPSLLDQLGLVVALEKHGAAFRDRVGMTLHLECRAPSAEKIAGERATNLFRIAQEALQNIEKHARADEARLRLLEDGDHLHLEVADNGCSFHPEHAVEAQKNGRLGLVSMRERAEMLGGTLVIHAEPGNGTVVRATVPLAAGHDGAVRG
jgi:two-component system NarL family sensor kinase